ncbi:MAG: ABC transporter ATP-binding protein [Thermofilaceae archaeon]
MSRGSEILEVKKLSVVYLVREGSIKAASDISFSVKEASITAIVGESGSGKSTIIEAITKTLPLNARVLEGEVRYRGIDLLTLTDEEYRKLRWREIAYVPQAAQSSLNPLQTVFEHFFETWADVIGFIQKEEMRVKASELLENVGLSRGVLDAYPHQLSGGMKQRVLIALSFLMNPKLLIMDEPVSALDVVNQSQILSLILELYRRYHPTILLITHDLPVAGELADTIAVMYAGHMVEFSSNKEFFEDPLHPYSKGLVRSMITFSIDMGLVSSIPGEPPSLLTPPSGCRFHPRCAHAMDICRKDVPPRIEISPGRWVRCWLYAGDIK